MELTFNHLLKRAQPQEEVKIGSPWLCIPIKNEKQAKNTVEIHMANQGINGLKDFDKFPNLEVLWLNNNKLTEIKGLDSNFRIKSLFVHDNKIRTLQGSLQKMGHLEALVIYNNELRNLDENIETLKEFPYLTELELFQNPLAEEPYYRLRVIHNLPNLKLLDRHVVTEQEVRKAHQWAKDYYSEVKLKKKKPPVKKVMPSQAFSTCETLLYKEVEDIIQKRLQQTIQQEKTEKDTIKAKIKTFDPDKLPSDPLKDELRKRKLEDPLSIVTEWEKGKFKKLFKAYDKEKKATLKPDDVKKLYNDLIQDKANLGKVPALGEQEFMVTIMGENLEALRWDTFVFNLNHVRFQRAPDNLIQTKINDKYYEFNKKLNTGKRDDGKEILCDAIRLENARDMDETQKFINRKPTESPKNMRVDTFDFQKYKMRKTFSDTAKYIL